MKYLSLFYKIVTAIYTFGVFVNVADGTADLYQALGLATLLVGWYLIDKK